MPARRLRAATLAGALAASAVSLAAPAVAAGPATTTVSAAFGGGTGTVSAAGVRYAKQGGLLTLTVTTSGDVQCVAVAGAMTAKQTSTAGRTSWTFPATAGAGDGSQSVTVSASPNANSTNCTGQSATTQASYVLDNTGPVVSGALSPAANGAGWNSASTTLTWTASDAGSGVDSGPTPASSVETANGVVTRTSTATDRLGNTGSGSTTVRVDKAAPTIEASTTVTGGDGTWGQSATVTFTCGDALSGVSSCLAGGSSTNAVTLTSNGTVTGTVIDKAGNSATRSVDVTGIDASAPVLSGAPTTAPTASGWYRDDVTVRWSASDPQSGIVEAPADTTIGGEGTGLTSTASVTNGAGLTTTATSSPAVRIDRTAPTTSLTGGSNGWAGGDVTLQLAASDNLSGVASTTWSVDGGPARSGSSVTLSDEGEHTVTFASTDNAGNVEAAQSAHVRIDRTAPTIAHTFAPSGYTDGAWSNGDVTVTFTCADQGGSGLASCSAPATRGTEGEHDVVGTAGDGAGNTASDHALVRIDTTAPRIRATASGTRTADGWYGEDVTVSFACDDALSGVASCATPVTLGEGAGRSAQGTARDAAGNTASDAVFGLDIDTTAPVLTAEVDRSWQTDDVTVAWTCTDALSGVSGPAATTTVVGGEGDDLSTTQTCTDRAGNVAHQTVDGIRIDRSAPTTTGTLPTEPASGWYTGDVEVAMSGHDNLSGVATTRFSVDGGEATSYDGAFTVSGDGEHEVTFWSRDVAGNLEEAPAPLVFRIDTTAPTTTVVDPISPDSGWFVTSGVPFAFSAQDGHGSGVRSTRYSVDGGEVQVYGEPFTADLSDGSHTVSYWSTDEAGNVEAHRSFEINLDTLAPQIVGGQTPLANAHGWNNTDVDVSFTCEDTGSGIRTGVAGCAGDSTLVNEGTGQRVVGDATDVAGNTSRTTYGPVRIDRTRPTLVGVPTTEANGAGWYRSDVTVDWVGDDALSGIDEDSRPAPATVTGEGRNRGAGPVSVTDLAGNTSAAASVAGLRIDRTAPVVTGRATTAPNAAGWYRDEVTVDWTCSDPDLADATAGSGVALCPTSSLVRGDGADQAVTSSLPLDVAGNTGVAAQVRGLSIDGSAPSTVADDQCDRTNGWCTGSTATVVLTATDQTGLSGVKEIHVRVDGGAEQVATGATTSVSVPLSGSGAGTVDYWAVDNAGNVEGTNRVALRWDTIAPALTHALDPAPNADDWNNSDVTVTFAATDDDAGSGLARVSGPVTVSTQSAGTPVTGTATDTAGNVGSDTVVVKLDKTAPGLTGRVTAGTLGSDGWYTSPVTVSFTCTDALSGVAVCPDPVVLTKNGANTAAGRATDRAGNSATVLVGDIRIDQEKPTLTAADVSVAGASYTLGSVPAATCTASDGVSGVASCTVLTSGAGVGPVSWTATATDRAGNRTVLSGTYVVTYRFDGFLQPVNDTAHQVGATTSIFKAGSTVPVKLVLRRADGSVVTPQVAPMWLTPVKGGATTAPVDESVYTASADSGTAFKYDATAQQWIYNWKSGSTGGNYWRVGVRLDDGQTYYVNLGLR